MTAGALAGEPPRLRVLSYNIHHCEGVDGRLDLERIARVIRAAEPDLVALQEVDRGTARTKMVDQPAELARLTDMEVLFEENLPLPPGSYGNAVLSRLPIRRHENHHLPRVDESEQRGVLEVELDWPASGERLLLLATHLDHRPDARERLASAAAIGALVAARRATPALLLGDLNARPDSAALKKFGELWTRSAKTALATYPAEDPQFQIDHVLFRPARRWRVVEVRVLEENAASDHRPIFAVLELLPEAK
jgi:endonuclease/exonuclease/phosphatase family metal-dependent hydrolase